MSEREGGQFRLDFGEPKDEDNDEDNKEGADSEESADGQPPKRKALIDPVSGEEVKVTPDEEPPKGEKDRSGWR